MKKYILPCFCLLLMVALLFYPKDVSSAVCDAVYLCAFTVIPSLFPFSVISGMLTGSLDMPSDSVISKAFSGLFLCSPVFISAFICGLCGGYPLGAAAVADIYKNAGCSKKQAEKALCFCCNSGPSFIISAIGAGILKSVKCGVFLFCCHLMSAILTGIVLRTFFCRDKEVKRRRDFKSLPFPVLLTSAVKNSAGSMISVCSCVVFFAALTRILYAVGITSPLISAFIEMTHGIFRLSESGIPFLLPTIGFFTAFGGLSVHMQAASLCAGTDLSMTPFFIGKCTHAALAFILTLIFLPVLGDVQVFEQSGAVACSPDVMLITFGVFLLYALKKVWK